MIEDFTRTAITTLLVQGTGWVVAVLLGIAVWVLYRRMEKMQGECDNQAAAANEAVKDQYEKRLIEFRQILEALSSSTQAVNMMQHSVVATGDAINQLAKGFAQLLAEFQGQQSRWNDRGGNMLTQMEEIRRRLEQLQLEVRR